MHSDAHSPQIGEMHPILRASLEAEERIGNHPMMKATAAAALKKVSDYRSRNSQEKPTPLDAPQDMSLTTSQSQKLAPLAPSVPLTSSEAESLRKEMKEAMEWAEKELKKDQAAS